MLWLTNSNALMAEQADVAVAAMAEQMEQCHQRQGSIVSKDT